MPVRPILLLTALLILPAACGSGHASTEKGSVTEKVGVVTTTTQLTDFARVVGGMAKVIEDLANR